MGAAVAIAAEQERMNPSPNRQGAANSTRVSSRSVNSVRAMALMNHARQENSYISQQRLNAKLKTSLRQIDDRKDARSFRPTVDGDSNAERPEARPSLTEVDREASQGSMKSAGSNHTDTVQKKASTSGLLQMRSNMNLNLKLDIKDENDWVQVLIAFSHLQPTAV